jgi:lipopolysaccharide transport system ATP-binding protein
MNDAVIRAERLSKRYLVGHEAERGRHESFCDVLSRHGRTFLRKAADLARGRQIVQGDRIEEFWALRDLSFEVGRGEVLGIIGRNGAGKSTLLKILSRITEPSRGRVTIDGRIASLLEVGTGFHPELSGRENIFLNGSILGMSKVEIRRKFDEIVEFSEVGRFIDTPVKRYSSGMYVRLAFAVAAHLEPEILIVDEVLAVGDAGFQRKCLGKMGEFARGGGRTVLFVSHNLSAVSGLCGRAVLLDEGRLVHQGPVGEVIGLHMAGQGAGDGAFARDVREATAPVVIRRVELLDRDGRVTGVVENGTAVMVRVRYRRLPSFRGVVIPAVFVVNAAQVPVFQHHSRLNKRVFDRLPDDGCFEFRLPRLPLPAGLYTLGVSLVAGGAVVDQIDRALEFVVSDGAFHAAGESSPASHGVVLVDGEWSLGAAAA